MNEISISASLAASKGGVSETQATSKTIDMVGEDMLGGTQTINVAVTLVSTGDIAVPARYIQIKNIDATNFVELACDANFAAVSIFAKLLPADVALLPPKQNIYARADTAVCKISKTAVEA